MQRDESTKDGTKALSIILSIGTSVMAALLLWLGTTVKNLSEQASNLALQVSYQEKSQTLQLIATEKLTDKVDLLNNRVTILEAISSDHTAKRSNFVTSPKN